MVACNAEPVDPVDRLFQIVAFRTFSKIETWQGVREYLGRYPILEDLESNVFTAALEHVKKINNGLYTGAFILCAHNAYGHTAKHLNHIDLFRHMFLRDALGERLLTATSLKQIYEMLLTYPLMGSFMAYQIAIDLNYSDLLNFGENDFTQAGPGALRGMHKAFEDVGDYSPSDIILWMVQHQEDEFKRLGLNFTGLWRRPLHAIDCQGLFCELDKYCREAAPELTSARKRIKARFLPATEPIPLFFPPKWGINEQLPL